MRALFGLLGGALCGVALVLAQLQPVLSPTPVQAQASDPRSAWAIDFLARLGNTQPTEGIVAFVVEWTMAEDAGDGAFSRHNPLNTTQSSVGETQVINGDGVRGYADYESGMQATIQTITNGLYDALVQALLSNNPEAARAALWASPWAASHYGYGASWPFVSYDTTSVRKCPVTGTMQVSAGFHATGSSYWAGQAGGMHQGVDYAGNPGDPVYAPFAFVVEDVGYYGDAGRIGSFVQARLDDGYLFYAGHLEEVLVQVGERVEACEQIGTIGAVFHTHVKIAPPSAPVPCEMSGCEDFEIYWSER